MFIRHRQATFPASTIPPCLGVCIVVTTPDTCTSSPSVVITVVRCSARRGGATQALGRIARTWTCVAGALLRFYCSQPGQETQKVEVYSSQSGSAQVGAGTGAMGVEQFSIAHLW